MKIRVALLWHMHQPPYKDAITGHYIMPWVRMHGVKGYYDMINLVESFPDIRQTFNLVPSLIYQIDEYANGDANDDFLYYTLKPADSLTYKEKVFILDNFFMANWDTMIRPYHRYWNLFKKRGLGNITPMQMDNIVKAFTTQEFLDIQVWFNLAWFGFMAKQKKQGIKELIDKGSLFTEEEKRLVIDIQMEILKELIGLYRKYQENKQIEITTSPFYHPIMPLIYDTDCAKRNLPDIELPENFRAPEDVDAQISKAVAMYKEYFNKHPKGIWPPEGSISPELIPILKKNKIKWIATDEGILLNSINNKDTDKNIISHKPYKAVFDGEEIDIIFRDRYLSDSLSFTYSKNRLEDSLSDFFSYLKTVKQAFSTYRYEDEPFVPIILDGENPWENYQDSGEGLLTRLYEKISSNNEIETVLITDFLAKHPSTYKITNLYTGSWINSNFRIWIGHKEDNNAWNYLNHTRTFLKEYQSKEDIDQKLLKTLWQEIYMAEASDWFWWYGDDFTCDNEEEFDRLFRSHLQAVYQQLNIDIPSYLKLPILSTDDERYPSEIPNKLINPTIDGEATNYFEWLGAGHYKVSHYSGSMYMGNLYLSDIYYGFNLENLFIRLDPSSEICDMGNIIVHIHLHGSKEIKIVFPLAVNNKDNKVTYKIYNIKDDMHLKLMDVSNTISINKIIELLVPLNRLGFKQGEEVGLCVELRKKRLEIARYPKNRLIVFYIPDQNFDKLMWSV